MENRLLSFFLNKKIEYFSVLSYADCIETSEKIIKREDFVPRSTIIYLLPYYTGETVNISRYAASLDYHLAIREINSELELFLKELYPEAKMRGYGDHSPIDERHAALISGLGIVGENGLLINEKYGSYVFIGEMITDILPNELCDRKIYEIKKCEGCGLCKKHCPTGVLEAKSTECLSAITQKKGELTEEEKKLMIKYNTAWGCDECQRFCPHNRHRLKTPIEFFYRERLEYLDRQTLDGMDKEAFERRAFAWRGRKTVERNLEILDK